MAVPEPDSQARAKDKLAIAALGRELDVETPRTRLAQAAAEVHAAAGEIGYPCVVKFRRGSGAVGLRVLRRAGDWGTHDGDRREPDLVFDYRQYIVQECVPGETHDVCAVFRRGELRAALTQRRLKTYPVAGGVGIDCVTTDEPRLIERAAVLMRALRWHGPAQIEFKVDPGSGRAWLIEINGRLWGTLALADWAGIDVPWMVCRMALDGDVEPQLRYRVGARYRWLLPLGLLHAAQSVEPWRALWNFMAPSRDTSGDWRWSDPWPHAAEAMYALHRMWSRGRLGPEPRQPLAGGQP
jgi:predicted ATP-grasp superfamily ATP-dependent carboligase